MPTESKRHWNSRQLRLFEQTADTTKATAAAATAVNTATQKTYL